MFGIRNKLWVVVILVLATGYCFIEAQGDGDLYIYLSAAGFLDKHIDIYSWGFIFNQYHYYYSVLFALLLKPFYTIPFYWVKWGWLMLNMSMFLHLFHLLSKSDLVQQLEQKKRNLFLIFSFVFSFRFLHENIHASQITILIFWTSIYGLLLISKNRPALGGAILAFGINVKLLPLVFLPYLLYRGYFKALAFSVLFLVVYYAAPSLLIDHDYHVYLLKSWWQLINPTNTRHVLDVDERSFHGLSTLLATLFVKQVPDMYALTLKRNIADISVEQLHLILQASRLILVGFTLWFLRSLPFQKARSSWHQCAEIAYLLLLIPLIFPHQQHYAFLFMCPAFIIVLYYFLNEKEKINQPQKKLIFTLLVIVYLTANLKILLGEFNRYFEHYKILTYGALLLIPLLAWCFSRYNKEPNLHPGDH